METPSLRAIFQALYESVLQHNALLLPEQVIESAPEPIPYDLISINRPSVDHVLVYSVGSSTHQTLVPVKIAYAAKNIPLVARSGLIPEILPPRFRSKSVFVSFSDILSA